MAVEGIEWLFIAVIVVILILWDPSRIPKIAKALAEAKKEYEKASRLLEEGLISEKPQPQASSSESDEKLIKIAKELGIETEGKTRGEIAREILKRERKLKYEGRTAKEGE